MRMVICEVFTHATGRAASRHSYLLFCADHQDVPHLVWPRESKYDADRRSSDRGQTRVAENNDDIYRTMRSSHTLATSHAIDATSPHDRARPHASLTAPNRTLEAACWRYQTGQELVTLVVHRILHSNAAVTPSFHRRAYRHATATPARHYESFRTPCNPCCGRSQSLGWACGCSGTRNPSYMSADRVTAPSSHLGMSEGPSPSIVHAVVMSDGLIQQSRFGARRFHVATHTDPR